MFDIKDRRVMQIGYVVRDIEKSTDEHYYLDTESIFGFVYEIGNNGNIRPPERRLG